MEQKHHEHTRRPRIPLALGSGFLNRSEFWRIAGEVGVLCTVTAKKEAAFPCLHSFAIVHTGPYASLPSSA
jgi:hypothetical protein